MNLEPGALVAEKYRIKSLLGEGGMGAVYIAENVTLKKAVALKVLGEQVRQIPGAVERFMREGISASQVRHPAIVEVYDAGTYEGLPWLAMELLQGESLRERLDRSGKTSAADAVAIVCRALSGLAAVHARGIIHRDLKPDNIFLEESADGLRVKILDFGIAKDQVEASNLTSTGTVLGTAFYLAPEQARDASQVNHRCDLYAMGAVLYETLAGRPPFEASTITELIAKLFTEAPPPLQELVPDVPAELAAVVHRCLERDPAERPQSASDLIAQLRSLDLPSSPLRFDSGALPVADTQPLGGPNLPSQLGAPSTEPSFSQGSMASPSRATSFPKAAGVLIALAVLLALGAGVVAAGVVGFNYLRNSGNEASNKTTAPATAAPTANPAVPPAGNGQVPSAFVRWLNIFEPKLITLSDGREWVLGTVTVITPGAGDPSLHLLAVDVKDGTQVWRSTAVSPLDEVAALRYGIVGEVVVAANGQGELLAYAGDSGRTLWEAKLSEAPAGLCMLREGVLTVDLTDMRSESFSLTTGESEQTPGRCNDRSVHASIPNDLLRGPMQGGWLEAAPASARIDGMQVVAARKHSRRNQQIVIGTKSTGTATPMAASLGTPAWTVTVPETPLQANEGAPSAATLSGEQLFVGYGTKDNRAHVAAFQLVDGKRLYDVVLPGNSDGPRTLLRHNGTLYVSHGAVLGALDATSGEALWHFGHP